jgi:two-component system, cell cycle response regulator
MAAPRTLVEEGLALAGIVDLERLQEALLAAFAAVTDALGAAVWVGDEGGGLALRAWRGLVDREALPGRVERARAETLGGAGSLRVPLAVDGELVGLVLLDGGARGALGLAQHAAALELAPFAAVAVRNARRFQAVERVGLRDRESGAYHLAYFVDHAGKELYKARRYGRSFSLAVLGIDNLDEIRREAGREALRAASRALVAAVSRVVRDADILARASDREHHVLLPETDHFGALMLVRRAREEIRREAAVRALDERCPLLLSAGAATFPSDGDEFDGLLSTCRARQEEQRASLVRRLGLDAEGGPGFWELADALLGERVPIPVGSASARLAFDPELRGAVEREAAREIGRDPRARGVLYLSRSTPAPPPALAALPRPEASARAGDVGAHVYVLGPRGTTPDGGEHPLVTEVPVDGDPRLDGHAFILFLSERAAYGFLMAPDGRAFHTSDVPLVDALVARLQALYDLQPL